MLVLKVEGHHGAKAASAAKLLQSCPTLCYPIDSSPPGSSVYRILQARILQWVAISFSKAASSSWERQGGRFSPTSLERKSFLTIP